MRKLFANRNKKLQNRREEPSPTESPDSVTVSSPSVTFCNYCNEIVSRGYPTEGEPPEREVTVSGETLSIGYHRALEALLRYGKIYPCPDWDCLQKECGLTMIINHPTAEPRISRLFIGGHRELQQYVMELLDGILDFEIYRGKWAYTYHDRMTNYDYQSGIYIDQVDFCINELRRNPYSRRAVIDVRHAEDVGSEHPACLQHIQFMIRDDKLECDVLFRSNDACKATFMNAFGLSILQERVAEILGVGVGKYVHRVNSFHCYEKDFPLLEGYVNRIRSGQPTTYDYQSDWKDEMKSYTKDIMEQVKVLKYGHRD